MVISYMYLFVALIVQLYLTAVDRIIKMIEIKIKWKIRNVCLTASRTTAILEHAADALDG